MAAPPLAASRMMRRLIRLRDLPLQLNTARELKAAIAATGALPDRLLESLRGVEFLTRGEQKKPNGSALLEFVTDDDAQEALRLIRKHDKKGLALGGRRPSLANARIGPTITEEGRVEWAAREAEEEREDEIGVILREIENDSMEMPTLEEVRDRVLLADQFDYLRTHKFPGLTRPEWDEEDAIKAQQKAEAEAKARAENPDDGPREPHVTDVIGRWAETIVKVDRVQRVVKGGTAMKYRALVVCGNLMGAGGFAYGKGATPQEAVARASMRSKKRLHFVDRFKGVALTHSVKGKHNNCIVNIFAVPPGYGTKGGSLGRTIMTMLGFSAFTIKAYGRRSPASYVRATFDALSQLAPVEDIARSRGRRLLEIETTVKAGLKWPAEYKRFE